MDVPVSLMYKKQVFLYFRHIHKKFSQMYNFGIDTYVNTVYNVLINHKCAYGCILHYDRADVNTEFAHL